MKYLVCLFLNLSILISYAGQTFEGIPLTPSAKDIRSADQLLSALPTTEGDTETAQKVVEEIEKANPKKEGSLSNSSHSYEGISLVPDEKTLRDAEAFLGELEKDSPKRAPSLHLLLSESLKTDTNVLDKNLEVKQCNSCTQTYKSINSLENINKELKNNRINTALNTQQLIVFVSFSLGDLTLQQLYRDIQKIGGQLLMRGLYRNSFRQTQKKIQDLKIVVDVDPTLFERFEVQEVPTFVIANTIMDTETIPAYDKLKGNVSLSYALETFEQAGNKEAGVLLKNLREGSNE